jgi:recombination protein RecR
VCLRYFPNEKQIFPITPLYLVPWTLYLYNMQFSSSLLENAVNEFARLPGVGKKTALRLVLHLLKQDTKDVGQFSEIIARMRSEIKFCQRCFNVADGDICSICANSIRKQEIICIVESIRDVIAIESTQQYNGTYHVLGGVISPLDGIGPDQLNIESLVHRIEKEKTEELIFALNPNIQGDTTIYYIQKKLQPLHIRITTIARGIAFGGELEYADEMTLARSLQNRLPVDKYVHGS